MACPKQPVSRRDRERRGSSAGGSIGVDENSVPIAATGAVTLATTHAAAGAGAVEGGAFPTSAVVAANAATDIPNGEEAGAGVLLSTPRLDNAVRGGCDGRANPRGASVLPGANSRDPLSATSAEPSSSRAGVVERTVCDDKAHELASSMAADMACAVAPSRVSIPVPRTAAKPLGGGADAVVKCVVVALAGPSSSRPCVARARGSRVDGSKDATRPTASLLAWEAASSPACSPVRHLLVRLFGCSIRRQEDRLPTIRSRANSITLCAPLWRLMWFLCGCHGWNHFGHALWCVLCTIECEDVARDSHPRRDGYPARTGVGFQGYDHVRYPVSMGRRHLMLSGPCGVENAQARRSSHPFSCCC
eukprot:scaffold74475_cov32-Tisochrysis_lutea.AAC.2